MIVVEPKALTVGEFSRASVHSITMSRKRESLLARTHATTSALNVLRTLVKTSMYLLLTNPYIFSALWLSAFFKSLLRRYYSYAANLGTNLAWRGVQPESNITFLNVQRRRRRWRASSLCVLGGFPCCGVGYQRHLLHFHPSDSNYITGLIFGSGFVVNLLRPPNSWIPPKTLQILSCSLSVSYTCICVCVYI